MPSLGVRDVVVVCSESKLRRAIALEASKFARVVTLSALGEVRSFPTMLRSAAMILVVDHSEQLDQLEGELDFSACPPVLAICTRACPIIINRAHARGWKLLCEPVDPDGYGRWLSSVISASRMGDRNVGAALQDLAVRWGLTSRQTDVLAHALKGERPGDIAEVLGVTRSTYRSHSRCLLLKSGATTIPMAAHRVLLRALELASGRADEQSGAAAEE